MFCLLRPLETARKMLAMNAFKNHFAVWQEASKKYRGLLSGAHIQPSQGGCREDLEIQ